jgi:hypothetical protein
MITGCVALLSGSLCFSGTTITCVDEQYTAANIGVLTCKDQSARIAAWQKACVLAKQCAADGSWSTGFMPPGMLKP